MKGRALALVAAAGCLASASWCAVKTLSDPKANAIRKVCILPAEASLTRLGMKGGARLANESEVWALKLDVMLKTAITTAGGVVTGEVSLEALQGDDQARDSVVRLRRKYENISVQMRKKPGDVKKGRYTLGDEVALVPCAGQADSLAFLDAAGTLQTGGRRAFDVLTLSPAGILTGQGRYDIWIALVDAKTGKVTALLHDLALGGKTAKDPEDTLSRTLTSALSKLQIGAAADQSIVSTPTR